MNYHAIAKLDGYNMDKQISHNLFIYNDDI